MVSEEQDEVIERIAARLRPLPDVDPAARARVLVAVAAERQRDREREEIARRAWRMARWAAIPMLAAAMVVSVLVLERVRESGVRVAPDATAAAQPRGAAADPAPASLAARNGSDVALRPVELVFRAPDAHSVSLVGDFTGWDPSRAVMTRDSGSGLWSVTVSVAPGRHVYAFLVNDSVWVRDPRAPSAPDADFGRPGSVLLVGRP